MYFKRLEIFGFKSFADKTVLNFEPGITAVVGPNGCGKSNIFDSIRWVLGEQSVKELRGSSMEDVIFNGTDKKPGLGFAEVHLTFSNESRLLPVEQDEIIITRRLFRSGESEYLMNKNVVRLRDIQELFMGTGIGAEAYSLVQQGKVDLIVSARPEDRRVILDEASGITKYKSKKREALNKLKDTENNLLRINDIILEVKRQIGSIERQATKARRYKEEFEKLKTYEIQLSSFQIAEFNRQKEQLKFQLDEMQAQENSLTAELNEINNLLESQGQLLAELEQKINEVNSEDIKLEGQIDVNNRQIGFNEERIQNIDETVVRVSEKKTQLIERCRKEQERIEELKQALAGVNEALHQKARSLKEKKEGLSVITNTVAEAQRAIKQYEEVILDITAKQVNVKNELTEVMKEIQGCLARTRRLELENTKVLSEKSEVDTRLKNVCEQIEHSVQKLNSLREEQEKNFQALNVLAAELAVLDQSIAELERKKILLISQKEFIEEMRVQYQDMPDPVVEGKLITPSAPLEKHSGIIGKVKDVRPVEGTNLYEISCEAKFIELDPQDINVRITGVEEQIAQRKVLREELAVKIEEQKFHNEQVAKTIHGEEKVHSILESQKNDVGEEVTKLTGELELVDSELQEVRESLAQAKKSEQEFTYHFDTLAQDFDSAQNNIKERENFINVKRQEKEEVSVAIAQLETELESDREKHKSQLENLTIFEQTLDNELEEIKRLDDEQAGYAQKREQFQTEIAQLRETIEVLRVQKQSLKSVLSEQERRRVEVAQRLNGFRSQTTSIEERIEEIRQKIHGRQMKDQEMLFSERAIKDRLLQAYRINIDELAPEMIQPVVEGPVLQVGSDEFMQEIERLKKRCESYGSVNLVAIEEFEELKQRFEFLTKQQSDLLEAKESLAETITKINRKTRQMFLETFTRVSEEFRIYYRMLFGGGEAQLVLIDPENVLESGIEIVARPPGKKLQNISLLSGGEKSLTAIALIFGVFKVRPSPFCILDEIDAALDEANVGRFSYLLKDFAKIAQFIVITHNKKTIASADVMYGITMQETGVSKIVSVKFHEAKQDSQEAVAAGV